jgi:hypothetical protein
MREQGTLRRWRQRQRRVLAHRVQTGEQDGQPVYAIRKQVVVT